MFNFFKTKEKDTKPSFFSDLSGIKVVLGLSTILNELALAKAQDAIIYLKSFANDTLFKAESYHSSCDENNDFAHLVTALKECGSYELHNISKAIFENSITAPCYSSPGDAFGHPPVTCDYQILLGYNSTNITDSAQDCAIKQINALVAKCEDHPNPLTVFGLALGAGALLVVLLVVLLILCKFYCKPKDQNDEARPLLNA